MTLVDQALINRFILHESKIPYAYKDSLGYWTIGIGRLIDNRRGGKLSDDEMLYLLNNDIKESIAELTPYRWFTIHDQVRQGVLIELVFNIGLPHLLEFIKMIAALTIKDYITASHELANSEWAKQVGINRVSDMQHRLLTGTYS